MFQNKKPIPPPWLANPRLERFSIGWRMGVGEDYLERFDMWFGRLSASEQAEYQSLFPEPVTWSGWWNHMDNTDGFAQETFFTLFWKPDGVPKYTRAQLTPNEENQFCMFWGHHPAKDGRITKSCFSQWWMSSFCAMEQEYCCMEQYMMAQKALLFGDMETYQKILDSTNPKEIKSLGRQVKGFEQAVWDKVKYSIVLGGNYCKFSQNYTLRAFLLSTAEKILVEASPCDQVWGIGLSADAPDAENPLAWLGENLLGFALMEVRDELRRVTQNESLCDWEFVKKEGGKQ